MWSVAEEIDAGSIDYIEGAGMTEKCQSIGNNSDPERFVTVFGTSVDAGTSVDVEKLHNNGSNHLRDLQQPYTKDYDRQQINETPDLESATHSKTEVPTLSGTSAKVHWDDHQRTFHSNDSSSQYLESQEQNKEIFSYGNHNSVKNLSEKVEPDSTVNSELELHHGSINDVNTEKNPVAVSESDSDDDNDGCRNPLPTTDNTDDYATMLMANCFTTECYCQRYYSCLMNLKKGGNGEVYRCTLLDCDKLLACKKEHKSLLYNKQDFDKLCHLQGNQYFLPILAYLLECCDCGEKHCSGYVGYLIMEYLPLGNILNIVRHLKSQLSEAKSRLKEKESTMAGGAIYSTSQFHKLGLLHLDIKEGNFLVRKRCCHTNTFDCNCDQLDFDVLLMDYDYVHTEGTVIRDPRHTGTYQYRALPLLFPHDYNMMVKAERLFDCYSLCVMIISIICGEEWCRENMEVWKRNIIMAARIEEIEVAERLKESATSCLIANVRCFVYSTYDQTIEHYVKGMETTLKECVKHFCAGQK